MIDYEHINSGDNGLVVRSKLNEMLSSLIRGEEGINAAWAFCLRLYSWLQIIEKNTDGFTDSLREHALSSFAYTDTMASNLKTYVDGMNGGVSGFAADTSFVPDFPKEKAATVIAVGAGTYSNILDADGNAITIRDEDAITVFYKGANSTYWQYKSIRASAVMDISESTKQDILARVTGTSVASNSMTDSFKYLGEINSQEELNTMLDRLTYDATIVGRGFGYFRAKYSYRDIEIKNILLSSSLDVIVQVVSGTLRLEDGSLTVTDHSYSVLMRKRENGTWGNWVVVSDSMSLGNIQETLNAYAKEVTSLKKTVEVLSERLLTLEQSAVTSEGIKSIKPLSEDEYALLDKEGEVDPTVCYLIKEG